MYYIRKPSLMTLRILQNSLKILILHFNRPIQSISIIYFYSAYQPFWLLHGYNCIEHIPYEFHYVKVGFYLFQFFQERGIKVSTMFVKFKPSNWPTTFISKGLFEELFLYAFPSYFSKERRNATKLLHLTLCRKPSSALDLHTISRKSMIFFKHPSPLIFMITYDL